MQRYLFLHSGNNDWGEISRVENPLQITRFQLVNGVGKEKSGKDLMSKPLERMVGKVVCKGECIGLNINWI
jgi:hypothetical protein